MLIRTCFIFYAFIAACTIEGENTFTEGYICDDNGICVCEDELAECGIDYCPNLNSDALNCGECGSSVFEVGGDSCLDGVPVCASSAELCTEELPICGQNGCQAPATMNCDPNQQDTCDDARICQYDAGRNAFDCVRQSCDEASLTCDIEAAICVDGLCRFE